MNFVGIYKGSTPITKVYKGATQVWPPLTSSVQSKSILSDIGSVPSPPYGVKAVSAGSPSVLNVSWGPAIWSGQQYKIYLDGVQVGTSTATNYQLTGLVASHMYKIEVSTVNTATSEESDKCPAILRQTSASADSTATIPNSLQPLYVTYGGISLLWSAPTNAPAGGYRVYQVGNSTPLLTMAAPPAYGSPAFIQGLTPGTTYEIYLAAIDGSGNVIAQTPNHLSFTPYKRSLLLDYTAPTVPAGVSVTAGNASFTASWTASTDSGSGVRGYTVFVNNVFKARVTSGTSVSISGLTNATTYQVSVAAFDQAGNQSAKSTATSVTPQSNLSSYSGVATLPCFSQASNGNLLNPAGGAYVPLGANVNGPDWIWLNSNTVHNAAIADTTWKWKIIRVNIAYRDWNGGPYIYTVNNNLDSIISDYTARNIVVMVDLHISVGGVVSSTAGSVPDPSGRSQEQATGDWWVEIAKKYGDNPYVWFNLLNEPDFPNNTDLSALYGRWCARIRSVAPKSVIVLDANFYGQDIPTDMNVGTGNLDPAKSFVLSQGPSLNAAWGQAAGYAPIVFDIHFYSRWSWNISGSGDVTEAQCASRVRDYVSKMRTAGLPFLIGEVGPESFAYNSDAIITRVALYTQGTTNGQTTGVLQELGVGVLPWHGDQSSGMPLTASGPWEGATSQADTSTSPQTGRGLWDYTHS